MVIILLGVSILFQVCAAGMSLYLVKVSQRRLGWVFITVALALMALRRCITLYVALAPGQGAVPDALAEWVALAISIVMCAGVYFSAAFFRESRESRARLRDSESRYRSLFNEVSDGIVLCDLSGKSLEPNPSAVRMFGYSAKVFGRLQATDLFAGQELEEEPIQFDRLRQGQKLLKTRRLKREDGSVFHAEISSTLLATGQFVALIRDITSRFEFERALRENEAHLRGVLNSVFDAIVTVDLSGRVVDCNRGTCAMFRERREGLLGESVFTWLPGLRDLWPSVSAVSDDASEALRRELTGQDQLGRRFPVELSVASVKLEAEKRVVVAVRDMTQWKELQQHVLQTQKMEALGTLAGGVAHDFNNLLMVILGSLEMSLEDVGPEHRARPGLERALQAGKRGKALVRQILTFSRKETFEMAPVDLANVLDEALVLLRSVVPASIRLDVRFAEHLPPVIGDRTQLQQVFVNLVTNAYQSYEGDHGTVVARCDEVTVAAGDSCLGTVLKPGRYLRIAVQDFGCGISAESRERVFDPFYTTKKAGDGTGMGLSVVLGIVEQHGGRIDVESEPGEGSVFRLWLPASEEPLPVKQPGPENFVAGKGQLVLFVDDEDAVVSMGQRMLKRIGYRCEALGRASDALAFVEAGDPVPWLVITDLTMPDENGLTLARGIRARLPGVPIVLMTGNPGSVSEDELASHGVTRLLAKPFGIAELSECLAELSS